MVSVLAWSAIDRGFDHRPSQSNSICYFSAKYAVLMSRSKDWQARNQDNVSEWNDMSTHELLFQLGSTIKI